MFSKTLTLIAFTLSATVAHAQLATVCATVDVNIPRTQVAVVSVPPINLGGLCLCEDVASQRLTADSRTLLSSAITGSGVLGGVGSLLSGVLAVAEPLGLTAVNQATASCVYPSNAVSTCGATACSFTCTGTCNACPTGTTLTPVAGSTTNFRCVARASTAVRRSNLHARSLGACPFAQTACAVPGSARGKTISRRGYECIDPKVNIESCGGCRFPLAGESIGQDCTEIPHTNAVSCVASSCVVDSCVRGFSVSADQTECVPSSPSLLLQQ